MATLDIAKYRVLFPQFADDEKYPDDMIELYWELASTFISTKDCPCSILRGKSLEYAYYLLTAHLMTLALQASADAAQNEGAAGAGGVLISASIGEVSVSMAAPPTKDGWSYWMNQTPYGQQLLGLLSALSVGGFSVGGLPERRGFRKVGGTFA